MHSLIVRVIEDPTASAPQPAPMTEPAPRQARALITALLEAMAGRRPLHQLRPHLGDDAFRQLVHFADVGVFRRTRIGGIRAQMPTARSVEASATLSCSARWLTCVIRLDAQANAWVCTTLTVLSPGAVAA